MNIPLIRKTLARIAKDQKHFYMGTFKYNVTKWEQEKSSFYRGLDCGTACCFAGEAIIVAKGMATLHRTSYGSIDRLAAELLGLGDDEAGDMFYFNSEHVIGTRAYVRDITKQIRAYVFEKTGERV